MSSPAAGPDRRLLLVHAHPDDETIATGATMARYAAAGAQVTLVTCTLGEQGEVVVPELEHLSAQRDNVLGQFRIAELAAACAALGVSDHVFLGGPGRWQDSGMMGTPENDQPQCFWQAELAEPVAALVAVLRSRRPQVVITYDENGGYGHPDHIQAHRVTMAALGPAADPTYRPELGEAWSVAKVYWTAIPKSVLADGIEWMRSQQHDFFGVQSVEELPFGTADELVTTAVDARDFLPAKLAAMKAHATQIRLDGPLFALADGVGHQAFGVEYYQLVRGQRDAPAGGHERDLFAGL